MRKESSVLFRLPLKMLIYTIVVGGFAFVTINNLLEKDFERDMRERAISVSSTLDWAMIPLLENNNIKGVETLFQIVITNTIAEKIRIYNQDYEIVYSSKKNEEGTTLEKEFVAPIIKDGKLVTKQEDFKRNTYEIAIPIKPTLLNVSSVDKKRNVIYLKMNFIHERQHHFKLKVIISTVMLFFLIFLLLINNSLIKFYILSPLTSIKEGLKLVSIGKYDYKIKAKKGREVNDFIKIYNMMVQSIKENSEQLLKNQAEAERLSVVKGSFLANMTHELRTPLNSILGYSELLLEEEEEGEKKDKLNSVVSAGEHLLNIINNVLDFSKMDSDKFKLSSEPFNLKDMLSSVEELFSIHFDKRDVEFKINMLSEIPEYMIGDVSRLKQIIINLVSNALKFTDKGYVHINVKYKRNRLYLEVIDTGMGMEASFLPKIFDSFEQLDVNHKGTGLGMSITKALCKAMEGDIVVESELGKGSSFKLDISAPKSLKTENKLEFDLSILDDFFEEDDKIEELKETLVPIEKKKDKKKKIEIPKEPKEEKSKSEKRFKILVADDVKDNQLVLKLMLKKLDVDIDCVDDGKEALDLLRKNKYELFFLDIQMPIMNGFDVLRELTRTGELSSIYVVALTAYSLTAERNEITDAGAYEIITKPLNKEKLRALVSSRIDKWRS